MNNKGEMSSKMLVTVILLVASFAILLLMYSSFSFEGQTDKEVCHQSVIFRGTLPDIVGTKNIIPLKCQTSKVCIRGDKFFNKGKCDDDFGNADDVKYVNVAKEQDIEQFMAREMVDCWEVMGRGELSIFSKGATNFGWPGVDSTCVICSRIAFDKETLVAKGIGLSEVNVLRYMGNYSIPGGDISYSEYFSKGTNPIDIKEAMKDEISVNKIEVDNKLVDGGGKVDIKDVNSIQFSFDKEVVILFTQISVPTKKGVAGNTLLAAMGVGGVIGGTAVSVVGPAVLLKGAGALVSAPVVLAGAIFAGVGLIAQQGGAYYNQGVAATRCQNIYLGEDARSGCSAVRVVNYNKEDISQYCNVIESIT